MRYVTSIERLAMEEGMEKGMAKGIEQGIEQGIEKGIEQGIQQGQCKLLNRLLTRRFGELPPWAEEKLQQATASELENWLDTALLADSLSAVLGHPAGQH